MEVAETEGSAESRFAVVRLLQSSSPYFSIGRKAGKIPELDGLRGIAILLVLLRHAAYPVYGNRGEILSIGNWDIANPLLNGWMGVDLFFVLSGFLITHHLLQRWPKVFDSSFMGRYWLKRILRTFPAYFVAVLAAMFAVVPLFDPGVTDYRYSLTIHILFLQDYLGTDLVAAFWSLGVEEKFYLLCPLVLLALKKVPAALRYKVLVALVFLPLILRIRLVADGAFDASTYAVFFWEVRSPFHLAMDGLWVGVICALLLSEKKKFDFDEEVFPRRLCQICITIILVTMFSFAWFDQRHFLASTMILSIISIAFGGILLSVCFGRTAISKLLRARWLRVLSVLSYSVYLVHLMFVPLAMQITTAMLGNMDVNAMVLFLAFLPVFALLSFIAGSILHFAVEKPFLILKDRIRI